MSGAHYFSHDSNARNDQKIMILRTEFGWEGYGIYFAMLEIMFDDEETAIKKKALKAIAYANNIDYQKLSSIITLCISENLFEENEDSIWSHGLKIRKEKYLEITRKRSEAGKKAMKNRWHKGDPDNRVITKQQETDSDDITIKEKEIKEKEIKELTKSVIEYLNEKAGTGYKPRAESTIKHIGARSREGYVLDDFKRVIDFKCKDWKGTEYAKFLRPETLFGNKFEGYYNTMGIVEEKTKKKYNFVN